MERIQIMDLAEIINDIDSNDLLKSYNLVYQKFKEHGNLDHSEFQTSRQLFEDASVAKKLPKPKKLEVVAVVAGLEFSAAFVKKLQDIQTAVSKILGDTVAYWVLPQNLGLEIFVLKWPEDNFSDKQFIIGREFLNNFQQREFKVHFNGFQIHRDGCVIARGIDFGSVIRNCRTELINKNIITSRQSNWAHVPLGRILEPFSDKKYQKLIEFIHESQDEIFHCEVIDKLALVHETRWYMEEKSIVDRITLPSL